MKRQSLSERGRGLLERPPMARYIAAHFERIADRWHSSKAPNGYIGLCIAENNQVAQRLSSRLERIAPVPPRILGYDSMIGTLDFRERLAAFMSRAFIGRAVEPERIAVLAGAGTVLELLFHVICDAGDAVLVPTPSYAGFWADLETRDQLTIIPVHRRPADGFRLTSAMLDDALAAAVRPVRALLFTNPDNPLGKVHQTKEIEDVLQWGERVGVHLIFDEIYALSVFGERPFISSAALRPTLGERVHVVWAFSKDFGASGLRCGVLFSENEDVIRSVDALAYWGACSSLTQHALGEVIADTPWVDEFVAEMRCGLATTHARLTSTLTEQAIPYVNSEAGFFVMCDLRSFLREPTWNAESQLWHRLLEEANVNLTPGSACRGAEPGFFRLCYASESLEAVITAVHRIGRVLHSTRTPRNT